MKKILLLITSFLFAFSIEVYAQHPTNLQSSNISSNSVDLSWDQSPCSGNVYYRYRIVGNGWTTVGAPGVSAPPITLTGLTPSTDYEWAVKCVGVSGWSGTENFTTVSSVSISNVTLDTIQCHGGLATITVDLNNTNSLTVLDTVQALLCFELFNGFWTKSQSIPLSSSTTQAVFTGVDPFHGGIAAGEYKVRLVDSIPYYNANNLGSGFSSNGIIAEYPLVIDVDEPDELLASTNSISGILCYNDCNAEEDLVITGGTSPYSFDMGGSTVNISGSTHSFVALCGDSTYSLTVSDDNGCLANGGSVINFTIAEPEDLIGGGVPSSNYNGFDVKCNGSLTGEITASALAGASGTGLLEFSIDGNPFTNSSLFTGLSAGNHTIIYKDANLCTDTQTINLSEPPLLSGVPSVTEHVTCFGFAEGDIDFSVSATEIGAGGPYTYSIDGNNFQNSSVFENNFAGLYNITVEDINDCQYTDTITIIQPEEIVFSISVSDYNGYEISCLGQNDGQINFTPATGGLGPISYSIDANNFAQTLSYNNLSAGNYNIVVVDSVGCQQDTLIPLSDPGQFDISYVVSSPISCPTYCNGEVQINPINGAGQILYNINGGVQQTSPTFTSLCDNSVAPDTIVATDANGCSDTLEIIVSAPPAFVFNTSSILEYCSQNNGQASINVTSGGTGLGTYNFSWNTIPTQSTNNATNLESGIYNVTVSDANNCSFTESVTVGEDLGFQITFTTVSPCLGDSSGSAIAAPAGGTPTYSYQWSDINGVLAGETSATLDNMPIGSYTVSVTDNGVPACTVVESVDILPPSNLISVDTIIITPNSCFGINDAQIEVVAVGGLAPYNYNIEYGGSNIQIEPSGLFTSLTPETYVIKAFDANGCFDDTTIIISYPQLLEIDSTIFTDISCHGANDGSIQAIQYLGGTAPYQFSVDGGPLQGFMSFSGLGPNQHTVEILDANNCGAQDIIFIDEPTELHVEMHVSNWNNYQIQCHNDTSGYVDINASGATAPYFINTSSFNDSITVGHFSEGVYTFLVYDSNGCEYEETITFNEPSPIMHNFVENHILCSEDGSVTDSVYGGVGSATTYTYLWNTGETTYSLDSLSPGWYTITVTDLNGCHSTDSVKINDNGAFQAVALGQKNLNCFTIDNPDGMLSVLASGGEMPYTYLWNDSQAQTNDTAVHLGVDPNTLTSDYQCIIEDDNGCILTVDFILTMPKKFDVEILIDDLISCNGLEDGKLTADTVNGSGGGTFLWNNNDNTETISNLSAGFYSVIAEDVNGCIATDSINLTEPDSIEVFIEENDIDCFGEDGFLKTVAIGGTSFEFTYDYELYAEDGNVLLDSFIDFESGGIDIDPTPNQNFVPEDTLLIEDLGANTYYIIAIDRNGCQGISEIISITEPAELTLNIEVTDETCDDQGIIFVYPEGGTGTWDYFIDGNNEANSPQGAYEQFFLEPGEHDIEVIDESGCSVSTTAFIKAYDLIFLPNYIGSIDTTVCLGKSIEISIDERPGLVYTWNDGLVQGSRTINLDGVFDYGEEYSITYVVTVTDENDCEIENTVTVNFEAIDPMIESDPEVEYGDYPVILAGDNINLSSANNNGEEYTWSWSNDTIINADGEIVVQGLLSSDWFHLFVEDEQGCIGYDSIYVVVGVKTYEYITPNNDGYNDEWLPVDIQSYPDALLRVFNRWGGLVWEANGGESLSEGQGWDGTQEGKELPVGTYYYIIDLNTGDEPQTGPITIIR